MALNITGLVPASEKAKNVATEDYVDTQTGDLATNLYYPDTTTINGGNIYTGSVDATKIDTTDLVVQRVYTGDGTGFSLSAYQDVGPDGDKNYNIYGAKINGGTIKGSLISGGVVAGAFIQASTSFDQLTEYTSCPDYPGGMPVVNTPTNMDNTTTYFSEKNRVVTTGAVVSPTSNTNFLTYYNCDETIYKLKKSTTPVTYTGTTVTLYDINHTKLMFLGETLLTYNRVAQKSNPMSSVAASTAFSSLVANIRYRGTMYNIDLTSYLSTMSYSAGQTHYSWGRKVYVKDIPNAIKPGLGLYLIYYDDYGYYEYYFSSFNPPFWYYWLGQKRLCVFLRSTDGSFVDATNTGTYAGSILDWDLDFTVGTDLSPAGVDYLATSASNGEPYTFTPITTTQFLTADNTV